VISQKYKNRLNKIRLNRNEKESHLKALFIKNSNKSKGEEKSHHKKG
jgi:hypothetical protein